MATAMYLEHYLDSLESLPLELQRNFNLMKDLDSRSQELLKKIDHLADAYIQNVRGMSPDKQTKHVKEIQRMFSKSKEFGDDKVQLAMQTYEMVDKHIRRLDADLARFEAELKEKSLGASQQQQQQQQQQQPGRGEKGDKKRKKDKDKEADDEQPKKKKRKSHKPEPEEEVTSPLPSILPLSMTHPSDVLDMPVDPNEPTYCLCHQVSYGEMIGCDNQDCPIEWFHFACVGLTIKPKGKWFCPRCTADRKKKA